MAELVDGHALDDFPLVAVGADGEGEHETFVDAVAAVAAHRDARPVARWGGAGEAADSVTGGIGGGGGRGKTACLDDGGATLLHGADELTLEPSVIADHFRRGFATDLGVVEIRILSGAVIAPDGEV